MKPSSESDQEDVRAQVEGIATLLKASIPPGKDIHGRPSPPSEKPQQCDCGRFPRVHDKGDLCDIGFNEFLGRVQGKLIDMGYEPPLWPEPHIRDCGDVDEALDVCVQWCAARLDEAKAAQSATGRSFADGIEAAARLVEVEYAHDKQQSDRLKQIAQHIRATEKRKA